MISDKNCDIERVWKIKREIESFLSRCLRMNYDIRITNLERRMYYIVKVLGNFTFSDTVAELSRRVVALEGRFNENSLNMDNGIRNVYRREGEEEKKT